MFRKRRVRRLPPGVALPALAVTITAMCVAGLGVAGRVAGLYPRWVVFAIAAVAGVFAGLTIRGIRKRADAIARPRRT
jgi:hypothetical protein